MKINEIGAVGKITKQNATPDAPIGSEFANLKKLSLGSGKPKELDKKARKNSTPNKLFNMGLTEGYSKDIDEKFVTDTITHFAKKYGISPTIALAVWRSEGGMNWQSKLKPKSKKVKTDNGQEASYGPFQLYTGKGGLGSAWEKLTGKKLSSSTSKKDIASQIDFALKTVPKRGWQDFKGANRVGINQYDGVPTKNNPMYNKVPIPKPTDIKKSNDMYDKVDKINTKPSLLDPRPLGKAIKNTATDFYKQSKKELGNIEVDKDSFTYKNVVEPAGKAYDYISKGFTGFMKDLKKSPEYKAAGEKNKKLYGPKNTVKEELVTELVGTVGSIEHLINRINKVADICATMGNKPLLYRMLRGTSTSGRYSLIQKVTPRGIRDEKLLGSGDRQNHVLNKLGIEHAVFATMDPHPGTQGKFGANFFMVPIGAYKIYSSPQVKDLGSDTSYSIGPAFLHVVNMDPIADTYKEGWPSAGFPNEVILDCEQYYMINVGEFVKKYAGEKARQMYTRDTNQFNKIKNDINKELLTSRFKTYNDMAWYLRNPVTNLLNLSIKQESIKELKIVKPDPKDTLGIKRKNMPQIKKQDYEEFIEYLQKNGATFKREEVPADELKAMQAEFSDAGVLKQLRKDIDKNYAGKAIIVSEDDYVLDGHHRWLVAKNTGRDLDIFRVNMPAFELFDLVNEFEKVTYKDITNERGSIGVPLSSGLTVSIFPHRPLKIKKPTKGKLTYDEARGTCWHGYEQKGMKKKGNRMVPNCVKEEKLNEIAPLLALGAGLARVGTAAIRGVSAVGAVAGALASSSNNSTSNKSPGELGAELAKVTEAFNNPYPIDWGGTDDSEGGRWIGNSKLADGSLLTLEIDEIDPGRIQIDFYRKDKSNITNMKATGQGDEFRVFATVQKGILEWWESIDQDEITRIEFSASKEQDDSKNRHKLYSRFAKQWAAKIGWVATISQWEELEGVNFVLIRPNAAKFAKDQGLEVIDEDLRDWFKQKWVNIGAKKKGGGHPECGTSGKKSGYAKCVPAKKAASMTKKEKESAVRRKRAAQNKKGRGGKKSGSGKGKKPIRVSTKKKK